MIDRSSPRIPLRTRARNRRGSSTHIRVIAADQLATLTPPKRCCFVYHAKLAFEPDFFLDQCVVPINGIDFACSLAADLAFSRLGERACKTAHAGKATTRHSLTFASAARRYLGWDHDPVW